MSISSARHSHADGHQTVALSGITSQVRYVALQMSEEKQATTVTVSFVKFVIGREISTTPLAMLVECYKLVK